MALYVFVGSAAVLIAWAIATYNGLVRYRNKVDEAWSGIEVQLERRHDLVPNLVATVRAYAEHESGAFLHTTDARAIAAVRAIAEANPALRASDNFRRLQVELTEIEDEIRAARRIYNANVKDYNTRIGVFPDSLVASVLRFGSCRFIEIEQVA